MARVCCSINDIIHGIYNDRDVLIEEIRGHQAKAPHVALNPQIQIAGFKRVQVRITELGFQVTAVVFQVDPWWMPQYFIPLGGMIAGNSMNAISICLERLLTGLRDRRERIELALSMGATYREATSDLLGDAVRAGMIPSINALMTVGLVSLPGMMTGQILAGVAPVSAVK
jgi:putative ABC transport system permease protein